VLDPARDRLQSHRSEVADPYANRPTVSTNGLRLATAARIIAPGDEMPSASASSNVAEETPAAAASTAPSSQPM
jgi:hypothetical protein